MKNTLLQISLDRETVRELKILIALAAGGKGRDVSPETVTAFATVCMRRGISETTKLFERVEQRKASDMAIDLINRDAIEKLPQFDGPQLNKI